jgi:hypothetical protein
VGEFDHDWHLTSSAIRPVWIVTCWPAPGNLGLYILMLQRVLFSKVTNAKNELSAI